MRDPSALIAVLLVDDQPLARAGLRAILCPEEGFEVSPGDRIAQLVLVRVESEAVEEVDELGASERGAQGFGSSGS